MDRIRCYQQQLFPLITYTKYGKTGKRRRQTGLLYRDIYRPISVVSNLNVVALRRRSCKLKQKQKRLNRKILLAGKRSQSFFANYSNYDLVVRRIDWRRGKVLTITRNIVYQPRIQSLISAHIRLHRPGIVFFWEIIYNNYRVRPFTLGLKTTKLNY